MIYGLGVPSLCASGLAPCSTATIGAECTPDDQCTPKICASGLAPCSAAAVGAQCTPDEQCDFLVEGSAVACPDGSYPLPGQPCPNATPVPGLISKVISALGPSTVKTSATSTATKWPWVNWLLVLGAVGGGVYAYRRYKRTR
jgi:hypothetical protein